MDNEAQDEEAFSSEVTTEEDAVLLMFSNFEEDSFLLLFVVVNESYAGGGGVAVDSLHENEGDGSCNSEYLGFQEECTRFSFSAGNGKAQNYKE